jgi:S-adenosylmethionine hydrolase
MAVDKQGHLYVGGDFRGALAAFGSQIVNNHGEPGFDEIYLVKIDPDLNVVWARSFGGWDTDEILCVRKSHLCVDISICDDNAQRTTLFSFNQSLYATP